MDNNATSSKTEATRLSRRVWRIVAVTCFCSFIALSVVAIRYLLFVKLAVSKDFCSPDGTFLLPRGKHDVFIQYFLTFLEQKSDPAYNGNQLDKSYYQWPKSGFFSLTSAWGSFSFSVAKFIDIIWDVLIGRGGQLALGWVGYKVFTKSLLLVLESTAVSYQTYAAVTVKEPSVLGLWSMISRITFSQGLHARLIIVWIIIASTYIITFPTLMSAATGYSPVYDHYVNMGVQEYDSMVPFSAFDFRGSQRNYTIVDGHRLNLTDNYHFSTQASVDWLTDTIPSDPNISNSAFSFALINYTNSQEQITVDNNTCHSIACPLKIKNEESDFYLTLKQSEKDGIACLDCQVKFHLASPTLDITTQVVSEYSLNDTVVPAWWFEDLNNHYCLPTTDNRYQWGFSFNVVFVLIVLTFIWSVGMFVMWFDAHQHSALARSGFQLGTIRAMLDFANAMQREFGEDLTHLNEKGLEKTITQEKSGIQYSKSRYSDSGDASFELIQRRHSYKHVPTEDN